MRTATQLFCMMLGFMLLFFGLSKYGLYGVDFAYVMILIVGAIYFMNMIRENWFMLKEWDLRTKETENYWRLVDKRPEILTAMSRKVGFDTDEV